MRQRRPAPSGAGIGAMTGLAKERRAEKGGESPPLYCKAMCRNVLDLERHMEGYHTKGRSL